VFSPYRFQPPPTLDEVRNHIKGTPAAAVLERALTTRIHELQKTFLSTEALLDWHAGEGAAVGRDPLGLHFAYSSINRPDAETGEEHPYGYVEGGMGTVSRLIAEAAEEAGATIHLNQGVEQFLVENETVVGIRLSNGTEVRSRSVISNLDPKRTFLKLMPQQHIETGFRNRLENLITNVSCYKLLAVISELPQWKAWDGDPELPHRGAVTLHSSRPEIDATYNDLEAGKPPEAPAISFSMPSIADPGLTQPGYHTASIWIYPAPAKLANMPWHEVREQVQENLIDRITDYAPNFKSSIRHVVLRTPEDLELENGLTDGCIWHVQHAGEHLFWNRPLPELSHYRAPQRGLYLCGAGQHPGGEVSGIPGYNAAHELLKDL
ncbi:MAG: NAD(P)/FAD-dependent oxidoreductase, partial [bacterium]|nr:NAD(P)/FAD-dependent oxidoreductase [bacterium]